jgi:hypothetical protein
MKNEKTKEKNRKKSKIKNNYFCLFKRKYKIKIIVKSEATEWKINK